MESEDGDTMTLPGGELIRRKRDEKIQRRNGPSHNDEAKWPQHFLTVGVMFVEICGATLLPIG